MEMRVMKSFKEFMMNQSAEMLIKIRRKIRCGTGAEGDDSSAQFFLWIILCMHDFENSKFVIV